mmetsp:Transcript_5949/g.8854  ORF Transcript_5949/g.8854 Transcript_5949/m.8854 type:complete len:87 (-) Transcript_5949:73-333(-)
MCCVRVYVCTHAATHCNSHSVQWGLLVGQHTVYVCVCIAYCYIIFLSSICQPIFLLSSIFLIFVFVIFVLIVFFIFLLFLLWGGYD